MNKEAIVKRVMEFKKFSDANRKSYEPFVDYIDGNSYFDAVDSNRETLDEFKEEKEKVKKFIYENGYTLEDLKAQFELEFTDRDKFNEFLKKIAYTQDTRNAMTQALASSKRYAAKKPIFNLLLPGEREYFTMVMNRKYIEVLEKKYQVELLSREEKDLEDYLDFVTD